MPQVQFTEEELAYIKRATAKLMEIRRDLKPADWKKPQNKLVKQLATKFGAEASATQSFVLDRNTSRAILQLCQAGAKALTGATIPEYKRRMETADAEKKAYYQPYLERAQVMEQTFNSIIIKLEATL